LTDIRAILEAAGVHVQPYDAKGPAEAATSPSHGPTNPTKDMEMNTHTDSTSAVRAARDKAVADAAFELEDDICSLLNMARILGDMLEESLVEFDGEEKRYMPEPGGTMHVYLGFQERECLSFAWNDVINRASRLKSRYYAALDAEARS
jgi:hypothetical protein